MAQSRWFSWMTAHHEVWNQEHHTKLFGMIHLAIDQGWAGSYEELTESVEKLERKAVKASEQLILRRKII